VALMDQVHDQAPLAEGKHPVLRRVAGPVPRALRGVAAKPLEDLVKGSPARHR